MDRQHYLRPPGEGRQAVADGVQRWMDDGAPTPHALGALAGIFRQGGLGATANTLQAKTSVSVSGNGLTAAFDSPTQRCGHVAATAPFVNACGTLCVSYYEVRVNAGSVSVGLSETGRLRLLVAYRSFDGSKCHTTSGGTFLPFAMAYGSGDTVGCGLNFRTGEVFFTRNGVPLGTAAMVSMHALSPFLASALMESGSNITFNFGATPFAWGGYGAMVAAEERLLLVAVGVEIEVGRHDMMAFVLDYLERSGYAATHAALTTVCMGHERRPTRSNVSCTLTERSRLTQLVLRGHSAQIIIPPAMSEGNDGSLVEVLQAQALVDCVHRGDVDGALAVVTTARESPAMLSVVALLAYPVPSTSPVAHLLTTEQRLQVAALVNACVVAHAGHTPSSLLEATLRQLMAITTWRSV